MDPDILIRAGRLLIGPAGESAARQRIHIRDGRIANVSDDSGPLDSRYRVLDLSAMTVLPGLIDCHTHLTLPHESKDVIDELKRTPARCALESIPNIRMKLMSGFTTVREAGSYWAFVDVAVRDAINKGIVIGPDMLVPGAMITMTGGGGALTGLAPDVRLPRNLRYGGANGIWQIRERIRSVVHHGADVIKLFASGAVLQHGKNNPTTTEFTLDELSAAVDEASSLGVKVMAHAHSAAGVKNAIRAGVASIEHGTMIDEEAAQMMQERGTFLVPTLSVWDCMGDSCGRPADFLAKAKHVSSHHAIGFGHALRAGVKIALGSDSVVNPHDVGAREFHYMVKFGMQPLAAIKAATQNAAELLGLNDVGVIAVGKRANLIAVEGDPTQNIDALSNVSVVVKNGIVHKAP